ncbi:MAG TPA: hypothetical protein VGF18_09795 [Candidatus Tumulicola sp.]|jgi:hypothetical protein
MNPSKAPTRALAVAAALLAIGCAARASDSSVPTMQHGHMQMTMHRQQQSGDRTRADVILAAARKVMAEYPTVTAAEAAGFSKFLPRIPLPIEHYTSRRNAIEAQFRFDPSRPTSLIFARENSQLELVGVMYTAPNSADETTLNERVPLSFGTWHRHVDFCRPASAKAFDASIDAAGACAKAGGTFVPVVFGWMVHVWPNEKTDAAIWAVDRNGSMERGTM